MRVCGLFNTVVSHKNRSRYAIRFDQSPKLDSLLYRCRVASLSIFNKYFHRHYSAEFSSLVLFYTIHLVWKPHWILCHFLVKFLAALNFSIPKVFPFFSLTLRFTYIPHRLFIWRLLLFCFLRLSANFHIIVK